MSPLPQSPTVRRHVTAADKAADPYAYVPVEVPEGTTRIAVACRYAKADDCIIDLGLLDATATAFPTECGLRGWSGGARDGFFVAVDSATPGYLPGPMPAGRWQIILGLYRVPAAGVTVELDITLSDAPCGEVPAVPEKAPVVERTPGWYRGDLHCHTHHSDARGAPERLHASAIREGLRFLAVSDHNTITQRMYFNRHSGPDLLFIDAMEVTTEFGHANLFGVREWIDFRISRPDDVHEIVRRAHAAGGLVSINHDKPPIEWRLPLPAIDCMEVWQGHWSTSNHIALARYDDRLRGGSHISLVGGSDYHQPDFDDPDNPFRLAHPCTVLWLDRLSQADVLDALRRGHGYVTEGPGGPHLSFTADGTMMGGTVEGGARPPVIEATVRGAKGDRLVWVDADGEVANQAIPTDDWICRFTPPRAALFLRAEIVAEAGRDAALAPILRAANAGRLPRAVDLDAELCRPVRRTLANPVYLKG